MKQVSFLRLILAIVSMLVALTFSAAAQFTINTGVGPFAPSFRGGANTTWFGWSSSFDGTPDNEIIDNPYATLGTTSLGYSLSQIGTDDILSSGNNIYTSTFSATLQLAIPIAIAPGGLFTTIILQGNTAFGGFNTNPVFNPILGVTPTVVIGTNATTGTQFWAKYEISSSAGSQAATIDLGAFTSIANLTVDTKHSTTAFASDTAQAVPEPTTCVTLLGGAALLGLLRRRHRVAHI